VTNSRVDDVINALHTAFDAAAGLDGVTVSKGWQILPAGDLDHLFVASDGTPEPEDDVATSEIVWAGLGALARTEGGAVTCAAWAQTGDSDDMGGRITRAYQIVGVCEDVVKADLTLGGPVTFESAVASTRLRTVQDTEGCAAIVVFTVTFSTRI